ncbi:MAG: hypothetical protein AAFX50_17810, partial [Acidobacteriota bacterium]
MMRLFWRILGGYLLAWSLLSLALFGAAVLDSQTDLLPKSAISQALPSQVGVQIAATNLRVGGADVFLRLVEGWQQGEP